MESGQIFSQCWDGQNLLDLSNTEFMNDKDFHELSILTVKVRETTPLTFTFLPHFSMGINS